MAASSNVSLQVPEHQHCIFCGLNANVTIYCSAPHNTMPPMTGGQKPHAYLPTGGSTTPAEAAQRYPERVTPPGMEGLSFPVGCDAGLDDAPQPAPQPDWVEAAAELVDAPFPNPSLKEQSAIGYAVLLESRIIRMQSVLRDALKAEKHAPKLPSAAEIAEAVWEDYLGHSTKDKDWKIASISLTNILQRVLDGGK